MSAVQEWIDWYHDVLARGDPRVASWPLMSSPLPTIALCIAYLIVVRVGTMLMASRKPFSLRGFMVVYNGGLMLLSAWMTVSLFYYAHIEYQFWRTPTCNPVDYSERGTPMAFVLYMFYFSKFIEFMDTFLMVLRKKQDQIIFLHLYHHVSMPLLWWTGIKYAAGGEAYLSAMMNSFVHVVMYGYYTLAALGIDVWWKRYLTQMQMIQFFINLTHASFGLYLDWAYNQPCPRGSLAWMGWAMVLYMTSLLVLFMQYYLFVMPNKPRGGIRTSTTAGTKNGGGGSKKAKKTD